MFGGVLIEIAEKFLNLMSRAEANQLLDVYPAWSDEGRVQTVRVVGGQEGQPRLTGHHSVQGIEKTCQGYLGLTSVCGSEQLLQNLIFVLYLR